MRRHHHRRAAGFNLIEAAIVLAVIGLVIGGIWVAASMVSHNMKVNNLYKGVLTVISNTRNMYGNQAVPGGGQSITPAMVSANLFPLDSFYLVNSTLFPVRHNLADPESAFSW